MIRYCVTIFLGAFLLFQVQPLIARVILPWFGGTAAVWTTCMMFFQMVLLGGYLYAHLLRRYFSPKKAWGIHLVLLIVAAALTSVIPSDALKPTGDESLTLSILGVLAMSIGLPFFALSATGPLVQAWQSTSHPKQSPYRLYALSNLGSMLALITYPFVIERYFPLLDQAFYWTIGFFVFTGLCSFSGWQTLGYMNWASGETERESVFNDSPKRVSVGQVFCWTLLSMAASIVLLATTNLLCQEVASVPFLWILPLVLYLLSFIICFDRPALYKRRTFASLLILGTILSISIIHLDVLAGLGLQIAGLATVCFAASMTCHGELERTKPDSKFLTTFYLWVSVGGALGGVFVCVVAPNLFDGFYEFHVGVVIALVVALVAILKESNAEPEMGGKKLAGWSVAMGIFMALGIVSCSLIYFLDPSYHEGVVFRDRNEYGLASVVDKGMSRSFISGRIDHGVQSIDPDKTKEDLGYYVEGSGVGVAFQTYRQQTDKSLNVGVVGLGAGAMANWLEAGDRMVFYEINPMVKYIADEFFTFLTDCKGDCEVVIGDGRIRLQEELRINGPAQYDLIFADAFSSDSIPIHLLTKECLDLYFEHLKPEGILIAHISNRFIDLRPVFLQHAADRGLTPILIDFESDTERSTRWVLLTSNEDVLSSDLVSDSKLEWPEGMQPVKWTDDFGSISELLNWSVDIDWDDIEKSRQSKERQRSKAQSQKSLPESQPSLEK